ncbi:MAG: thioredoxin [Candidatus Gracilibacteria bacterium]|nr:thioredoxin [Candidatus Gracilibacteria bacterium]
MADQTFTDDNFKADVIEASSGKPVLVDFFATWCGPCKSQAPIVDELAGDLGDKAVIGKIDVDENPQSAEDYKVMGIPAIKIFKGGEVVEEFTGLQQKDVLQAALEKHM